MTRQYNRKRNSLHSIAPFIAVLTVAIGLAGLAQTRGASQPGRQRDLVATRVAGGGAGSAGPVVVDQYWGKISGADASRMDVDQTLFLPAVTYDPGGINFSATVGDVNGDGKLDIVTANCATSGGIQCPGTGEVGVLLGNGDGTFQPPLTYDTGGYQAVAVAVADVNGDGKADVMAAICVDTDNFCHNGPGVVSVLLGNGDGTFKTAVTYPSGGLEAVSVTVADVNQDGKPDLLVTNSCNGACSDDTGGVGVLLGNGDGTFKAAVSYAAGGAFTQQGVVADVNGDGKLDVLFANEGGLGNSTVGVLLGKGDGTFQPVVTYGSGGAFALSVAAGDMNGDGKPDLVLGHCRRFGKVCNFRQFGVLGVLLGNGDGTFQTAVTYDSGGKAPTSVAVADLDGDGSPDLLVGNGATPETVAVLAGNGDGTFQSAVTYDPGDCCTSSLWVADLNGDGRRDLVVAGGRLAVLLNNSGPHSSTTTALGSDRNPVAPGQVVTYTATVTSQYDGPVTGTIVFKSGAKAFATVPLANNQSVFSLSYPKRGTLHITAVYSGDVHSAGSTSATLTEYVETLPVVSKTVVTTSGSPSHVGQAVTFTATVTSKFGAIPNGETVAFSDGKNPIGTGTTMSGVATFTTSSLSAKTHRINAAYAGDATFKPSSGEVTQVVEP